MRPKRRLLFGLFACRCQQRRREQIEKGGREGEKQREKRKKKQNRHRKTSREGRQLKEEEQFLSGATPGEFDKSNADQAEQETVPKEGGRLWVRGCGKGCIH